MSIMHSIVLYKILRILTLQKLNLSQCIISAELMVIRELLTIVGRKSKALFSYSLATYYHAMIGLLSFAIK
jgi:hypothetical protein